MQNGMIDAVITGADRVARNGDVANKIGTYLKAVAAQDNHIPFYVAFPSPTLDWSLPDGKTIPIEERSASEITHLDGPDASGTIHTIALTSPLSPVANPSFDVTPARLITGLITEYGLCHASEKSMHDIGLAPPPLTSRLASDIPS